jgi:thiol-disulfide isomerase/thioredoxin
MSKTRTKMKTRGRQGLDGKKERRAQARIARERALRRSALGRRVRTAAISVVVVASVLGLGSLLVRNGSAGVSFAGDLRVGGTLDKLSLPRLEGNGTIDYSQFSNRPLVLNFFASWCPNCIAEMPGFEQVHRELGAKVAFLGVSESDSRSGSIDLAHQTGITYPAGVDSHGAFFNAVGSTGMPTTLFIRPGGKIAYVQTGALDPTSLKQLIQRYLGVSA